MVAHRRLSPCLVGVPLAPVGVCLPVHRPLCSSHFPRSSGNFQVTGLSTTFLGHPQNFCVRPLRVHRVVHSARERSDSRSVANVLTIRRLGARSVARRSRARGDRRLVRVDVRAPWRHNRGRDVSPADSPRRHHHHSIAHVDLPRALTAAPRGGCCISPARPARPAPAPRVDRTAT
jgi:hypothetical protein